jgi:hypothetical protein
MVDLTEHLDRSAVAEHNVDTGTLYSVLQYHHPGQKTRYMDSTVEEAIKIELHTYSMNREARFVSEYHGSLLFGSSQNFWNMTADPLDYIGHTLLIAHVLRLLKQLL